MGCQKVKLVFLAGMPGSGKSVFSNVAKEFGIPVYTMGDVVRSEIVRRGLEPTLENLMKVANELRQIYGKAAIAKLLAEKLSNERPCIALIDGVRSLEEIETLVSALNAEYVIIAIHASPKTRFLRLKRRGRPGDPQTWEEFVQRDFNELAWGLGSVIALADVMIVNETSLDEFISLAKKVLKEVLTKWSTYVQR